MSAPGSLAVLILTHNEANHLPRAIASISAFASAVYVVDSGSNDGTVALACSLGAKVLHHPWVNYSQQFQWGLDNAGIAEDWVMRLDADEVIESDLAERIRSDLAGLPDDVVGITLDRKHIFMGRWIRHGGRYPLRLLRVIRRGHGRIEQRWMDEHMVVEGGRTVHFAGGFADHNLNDLSFFIDKHNRYATREAVDVLNQKLDLFARDIGIAEEAPGQASIKRWFKEHFYNRLPFPVSTLGYFLFRYVVQLGFLDGRQGLVYHFLQGYWYRFLVGAKVMEYEQALFCCTTAAEKLARLRELTGLRL